MSKAKNTKPKIALIGPYPPPFGGIAIHIQRLLEQLEKSGYECVVYELGSKETSQGNIVRVRHTKRWLLRYFFFAKEDIIHLHNPDWRMRMIMGLMGLLGKTTIISIHGASLEDSLKQGNWLRKQVIKFAAKHTSLIIALNPQIQETVLSLDVNPRHIEVIPSFIPPVVRDVDIAEVPKEVWQFMGSHTPVISANAFKIAFYNNQDLYGLDMCIDLCVNLKQYYPRIGLVFALPDIGDLKYFNKMKRGIEEKGIEENFLFQTKPCQFYPILMKSCVFVRPTNTDGDAISIREALYFGVPSITSDIVPRPKDVILFKNRDVDDFILKVTDVLDNYALYKEKLSGVTLEDNTERVIEVYQRLLNHD